MAIDSRVATCVIREAFEEEIAELGGKIREISADGERLFARAVLPRVKELDRGDKFKGGVAIRTVGDRVDVHPFVFRRVCSNGAIVSQTIDTKSIGCGGYCDADVVKAELRATVRSCAADETFREAMVAIGRLRYARGDALLHLRLEAELASRMGDVTSPRSAFFAAIARRFHAGRDPSAFGLMNAVTSLARDTADQGQRWLLEELGGAIAYMGLQRSRTRPLTARRRLQTA